MSGNQGKQFKCRCGRTGRPEVVNGMFLCPECAFDEEYVIPRQVDTSKPPVRPAFVVRRIA